MTGARRGQPPTRFRRPTSRSRAASTSAWRSISDGRGVTHEVRGEGVVGEQPVLEPGGSFDYVSGCPLTTPTGTMEGRYFMVAADGGTFEVEIPRFPLIAPAVTS